MPLPPNASITDVINKLTELEGINQKTELSSVIGSPALSTDTVAQQIVKLQDSKNSFATKLTNNGVPTVNTESIKTMVDKIDSIGGSITGIATSSGNQSQATYVNNTTGNFYDITVTGLTKKPKVIEVVQLLDATILKSSFYFESLGDYTDVVNVSNLSKTSSGGSASLVKANSGVFYVNSTGFKLPVISTEDRYRWTVFY